MIDTVAPQFGNPDDESLPITRCVCGTRFKHWQQPISIYRDTAQPMPCCGRRLYFRQTIDVLDADADGDQARR